MNRQYKKFIWVTILTIIAVSIVFNSAFTANWSTFRQNNQRTGINFSEILTLPISLGWSSDIFKDGARYSSPIASNSVVYIGSLEGNLYALNGSTGETLWQYPAKGTIRSTPAAGEGIVCFGCSDGNFYALDAQSGNLKWTYKIGNSINSSPIIYNLYILEQTTVSSMPWMQRRAQKYGQETLVLLFGQVLRLLMG